LKQDTGYDSVEKAELCIHTIRLMVEVGRYQDALELLRKSVDDKTLPPICDVMTLEGEQHLAHIPVS
jgi:hypothetical protein